MKNSETRVLDWLDNNQDVVANFLSEGLKRASVNPVFSDDEAEINEDQYQEFLNEFLIKNGFETDMWEPDAEYLSKYEGFAGFYPGRDFSGRPVLYGQRKGIGGGKSILLTGHADVVKPGDGWTVDPFGGDIIDGKIYGRGAIDMKGGIAAMLMAVYAIDQSGIRLKGDIKVATVPDEENGGMGTLAFVDRGYSADAAILTEATDFDIQPLCRGILWGEITVRGRSGHIELDQTDWRSGGAVDAIAKARTIMDEIDKTNEIWQKTKKHPLISIPCQIKISQVSAGDYPTTYADQAVININAQYLPSEKDEKGVGGNVKKEIEEIINRVAQNDEWLKLNPPTLIWTVDANCGETRHDHPFVKMAHEKAKLLEPASEVKGLASHSDMGFFIEKGIPTINFGPADSRLAHQDDEYVTISELVKTTKAITLMILDWCGYEE